MAEAVGHLEGEVGEDEVGAGAEDGGEGFLHHAVVVVTEGESFRMREARARGGGRQPKP